MHAIATGPSIDECSRLYRKIDWHILPLLTLGYFFSFIDRTNIGFAKLQMQHDIGVSDAVYGLGAGLFFIGYMLFEVPSNVLLIKIGARKTFSRIMVLWGLTSAAMMFVSDARSFYLLRFLLGIFEAGFAPGVLFYLSLWYPKARQARTIALFFCAPLLAGIINGPLSVWLMTHLAGRADLTGWQWLFVVEGLPCVALGVMIFFILPQSGHQATWLSTREKAWLNAQLAPRCSALQIPFRTVLKDARLYVLAFSLACISGGAYISFFWLPTLLKTAGVTDLMNIGWLSALPYGAVVMATMMVGVHSDRTRERRWHSALSLFAAAAALCLAALSSGSLVWSLFSMTCAMMFIFAASSPFYAMLADYLHGDALAPGIAFINSLGILGGFVSPSIIGWAKTVTGHFQAGLLIMASVLLVGGVSIVCNRLPESPKSNEYTRGSGTFSQARKSG